MTAPSIVWFRQDLRLADQAAVAVPELAGVEGDAVHDPHGTGIPLSSYPDSIIGHREGRARALAAASEI